MQPITCIESAKQALEATKEVEVDDKKTGEKITVLVTDVEEARRGMKFLAAYALRPPSNPV